MSLRDKLLTKPELKSEKIYLPDFNEHILIKAVVAAVRDDFELYMAEQKKKQYRAMWIAMCAADLDGNSIFQKEDMESIGNNWSARDINIAFNKAAELNGIGEDDREEIKNE